MTRILLRFDDLCPTMSWTAWDAIERMLDRLQLKPILAIVPENRDPKLMVGPANPNFWERARQWQAKGWVIGQHGYRHVYDTAEGGLVPWWRQSEFAGHPAELQRQRILEGQKALRAEGINPAAWVAPSHSFDDATLAAVQEAGIRIVSDGVGLRPTIDRRGLTWIPVQPWHPAWLGGTWTRCVHSNKLSSSEELDRFCSTHRERLLGPGFSLADVLASARPRAYVDTLVESLYWRVFRARRGLRTALRAGRPQPA